MPTYSTFENSREAKESIQYDEVLLSSNEKRTLELSQGFFITWHIGYSLVRADVRFVDYHC